MEVGCGRSSRGISIFTSGSSQVEALQALGIKRFVGVTYYRGDINDLFARYFREAGFEVLAMEGMPILPGEWHGLAPELIYTSIKKVFLRYPKAEGIYLLGSGAWQVSDVLPVEYDLGVPVVHPVAARTLAAKKRVHIRQPVEGMGRLLGLVP